MKAVSLILIAVLLSLLVMAINQSVPAHGATQTPTMYSTQTPYEDEKHILMVPVPKGSFRGGYTLDEVLQLCEKTKAKDATYPCADDFIVEPAVVDVNAFFIDKFEVSRADYAKCVQADVCDGDPLKYQSPQPLDVPVQLVNFYNAAVYCAWRGARLPTETEWEYAARGPQSLIFPWGNDFDGTKVNFCDKTCSQPKGISNDNWNDGYADLAPVYAFEGGKSWIGAYNLAGNIAEWTSTQVVPDNVSGPSDVRIVKGGAFLAYAHQVTGYSRFWTEALLGQNTIGFRCARSHLP